LAPIVSFLHEADVLSSYGVQFPFDSAISQVAGLFGYSSFQRLAMVRRRATLQEWAIASARLGRFQYKQPEEDFWNPHLMPRMLLAVMIMPAYERAYDTEWRIRTQLDLARMAVGVERFRLAYGKLPQRLDDMVPAFIDRVPGDFFNEGRPLVYRIKDNGEYVVYSYGPNGHDDNGKERDKDETGNWYKDLIDITFTVAPPEIRDRPQVAPAM